MGEHHAACVEQRVTSKGAIHGVGWWNAAPMVQPLRLELRDGCASHVVDDLRTATGISPHCQAMLALSERQLADGGWGG